MGHQRKRNFTRAPFETGGQFRFERSSVAVTLIDISLKGALVHTLHADRVPDAATGELSFRLSGSTETMEFTGELVRRDGDYLGFKFLEIDAESLTHLRRLLELNLADDERVHQELERFPFG